MRFENIAGRNIILTDARFACKYVHIHLSVKCIKFSYSRDAPFPVNLEIHIVVNSEKDAII